MGVPHEIAKKVKRGFEKFAEDRRGAINSLIGAAIALTILVIIIFNVFVPQAQSAISSANLTGTNLSLANLTITFAIIGVFVIVVAVFVLRWL